MHLRSYRDESYSRHFDLIGGGGRPWSIDLVSVCVRIIVATGEATRPSTGREAKPSQLDWD